MKRLMGKNDIENALLQLDFLTKEECLMTVVRNLEITHRVNSIVRDVDSNFEESRSLIKDVGDNLKVVEREVKVIEGVVQNLDHNVKATKNGR
jgi:hypothetical protein